MNSLPAAWPPAACAAGCSSSTSSSSGTSSSGLSLISLTDVIARGFDRDGPNTDPGFAEANYNTFDGLVAYPQPLTDGAFVPNFSADIDQFVPLLASVDPAEPQGMDR